MGRPPAKACLLALLLLVTEAPAQLCGDCDGDGNVDVMDALAAARHTVGIGVLGAAGFARCNVALTPGGPSTPGAAVDVLDAVTIAHVSVGIGGPLVCPTGVIASAGPFDVDFLLVPAETVSDKRFEVTLGLFDQATGLAADPTSPVLVTLSLESGLGPLRGSVRQWMRDEAMVFGNLIPGRVGMFALRAAAGAPHGDGVSRVIANRVAVEADTRGASEGGSAPYDAVRFVFRDHGINVPLAGGSFEWEMRHVSTGTVAHTGSVPLTGQPFVDATWPTMSILSGHYRVRGGVAGTWQVDVHSHMLRPGFASNGGDFFCTLATGRVGVSYLQDLRQVTGLSFVSFHLLDEQLPPGLTCSPTSGGVVSGTPTRPGNYHLVGFGFDAMNRITRVSFKVSIFSWRDTEVESGVDFSLPGPYAVSHFDLPPPPVTGSFWNLWSCEWQRIRFRFYHPTQIGDLRRLPGVAFLHDSAMDWDSYDGLLRQVASYGYVVATATNAGYPVGTCGQCGTGVPANQGIARATGFVDELLVEFLRLTASPGFPPYYRTDLDNLFIAGHGRGGATALLHSVFYPGHAQGVLSLMPLDPRAETCLVPTYLDDDFPPTPTLNLSAELDGDTSWPSAENAMEDAVRTGMDTHVTLLGANHNFVVDDPFPAEAPSQLCRSEEQARVAAWMIAFLERHARGDLRLDGRLYLGDETTSPEHAVFGRRGMEGTILVDDHQTTGPATNVLGGTNTATGLIADEVNSHPPGFDYGRTIRHRTLDLGAGSGSQVWAAPPGAPVDASLLTTLSFRARVYSSAPTSLSMVGGGVPPAQWELTISDTAGESAMLDLLPLLPPRPTRGPCALGASPGPALDRFRRFSLSLADVKSVNPNLSLASIQQIRMDLAAEPFAPGTTLAIDDLRFE